MEKNINKRIFYGMIIIAIFLVTILTTIYYNSLHKFIDAYYLIPFFVVLSLITGAGTYAFMSERLEKKEHGLQCTTDIVLKFLNEDERKVIKKVLESNGRVLQAEITRMSGMSKLRTHRAVKKLLSRRIIEIEKYGKTNSIKLTKDVKEGLIKI